MTGDFPLWLALAAFVGWVAGWISHAVYLEVWRAASWTVGVLRRLYGWHRARDARRLAALERRVSQLWVDLP